MDLIKLAKKHGATIGEPIDNSEWLAGMGKDEKARHFANAESHMISDEELSED